MDQWEKQNDGQLFLPQAGDDPDCCVAFTGCSYQKSIW
jgi:hypothetical protein